MNDIVNAHFRKFYPSDWDSNWHPRSGPGGGIMREYQGPRHGPDVSVIFPRIVCADGFSMSVQGHSGGYSYPRDDFADGYDQVEVLGPECPELGRGNECGDEWIYGYVPVAKVIAVIEAHGGIALQSPIELFDDGTKEQDDGK